MVDFNPRIHLNLQSLGGSSSPAHLVVNHYQKHRVFVTKGGATILVSLPPENYGFHDQVIQRVLILRKVENELEVDTMTGEVLGRCAFDFSSSMMDAITSATRLHDLTCPQHDQRLLRFCVGETFVGCNSWRTRSDSFFNQPQELTRVNDMLATQKERSKSLKEQEKRLDEQEKMVQAQELENEGSRQCQVAVMKKLPSAASTPRKKPSSAKVAADKKPRVCVKKAAQKKPSKK